MLYAMIASGASAFFVAPPAFAPMRASQVRMADARIDEFDSSAEEAAWKGSAVWSDMIKEPEPVFDILKIKEVLPHRYPFLLVDKIIEFVPGKKAVGIKKVTVNEE